MQTTFHFGQRRNQRGISQAMAECVVNFGEIVQDKYVINKKLANAYIDCIKNELKHRKEKKQ